MRIFMLVVGFDYLGNGGNGGKWMEMRLGRIELN